MTRTPKHLRHLAALMARAVDHTGDLYGGGWSQDYIAEWEDGAQAVIDDTNARLCDCGGMRDA